MNEKLQALRDRLVDAQHKLLLQAAEAAQIPSDNALRKISDLENAIAAIEVMIEERRSSRH